MDPADGSIHTVEAEVHARCSTAIVVARRFWEKTSLCMRNAKTDFLVAVGMRRHVWNPFGEAVVQVVIVIIRILVNPIQSSPR